MFPKLREELSGFTRPQFGQFITWLVIYIAIEKVFSEFPQEVGSRLGPVTVLSFLPDVVLTSSLVFMVARWLLVIAGVLWALQLLLPFSSWLTAISLTTVLALYYENSSHISHVFHLTNMVLIVHALWYHFHYREIKQALRLNCFWQSELYPKWVFWLSFFCIAIYHTYAGVSKLTVSGPQWANGLSLQLWVYLWGQEESFANYLILSNRTLTKLLQVGTLIFETGAILALFSRKLRIFFAVGLASLYVGILDSFNYLFHYNMVLVICFFFPLERLLVHWSHVAPQHCRLTLNVTCTGFWRKLIVVCVGRINMFGITKLQMNDPESMRHGDS